MSDLVYWAAAERVCTERQFEVLRLSRHNNLSQYQIASALGVDRKTVAHTIKRAEQKVMIELDQVA